MVGVVATPEVSPFDQARAGLGRPLPGRVAVLYPLEAENEFIQVPAWVKRKEETVKGGALEVRKVQVLTSGFPGIRAGDTVGVRCEAACMALEHKEEPHWVPEGYEIRIYGVYEPILGGSNTREDVLFFKVTA